MVWTIEFDRGADKEFAKLDPNTRVEIANYLEKLSQLKDPRSRGKGLKGGKSGFWRFRVGKYRIICKIEDHRLVIFVIRVAKRDTVYDD